MGSWSLDISKYAEKCKEKISTTKRRTAFALYSSIVKKTPVDTGRARGNWHITIGSQSYDTFDRTTETPMESEASKVQGDIGDRPIYIQNNLPYIVPLEYGSSKQAPQGMVGVSVANIQHYIDEAVKD